MGFHNIPAVPADGATKEFLVWPHHGGNTAISISEPYAKWPMDNGYERLYAIIHVPHDFTSLTSFIMTAQASGAINIDWTADINFAAVGEAKNANSDSDTGDARAFPNNVLEELDLTDAFDGIAAGDVIGFKFTLDDISAGGIDVLKFVFKYS